MGARVTRRTVVAAGAASVLAPAVFAQDKFPSRTMTWVVPFPTGFRTHQIPTNGTTLFVRTGGVGPAVVLLHGYGETGDMWGALAARLAPRYTVIVPDLRGMGLSARPAGGYDKKTQGHDIAGVLDALKIEKVSTARSSRASRPPSEKTGPVS